MFPFVPLLELSPAENRPCDQGDIAFDINFVYICVTTNEWKKLYIDTW